MKSKELSTRGRRIARRYGNGSQKPKEQISSGAMTKGRIDRFARLDGDQDVHHRPFQIAIVVRAAVIGEMVLHRVGYVLVLRKVTTKASNKVFYSVLPSNLSQFRLYHFSGPVRPALAVLRLVVGGCVLEATVDAVVWNGFDKRVEGV